MFTSDRTSYAPLFWVLLRFKKWHLTLVSCSWSVPAQGWRRFQAAGFQHVKSITWLFRDSSEQIVTISIRFGMTQEPFIPTGVLCFFSERWSHPSDAKTQDAAILLNVGGPNSWLLEKRPSILKDFGPVTDIGVQMFPETLTHLTLDDSRWL